MAYKIETVVKEHFPNEINVNSIFRQIGLPVEDIISNIQTFVCQAELIKDRYNSGYQKTLAKKLENHLENVLSGEERERIVYDKRYSTNLNEKADLVIKDLTSDKRIFFEIEFRPNVEKDLIKFQIGYNSNRLAAAVLILALDRKLINSAYTTMPEFSKFIKVIRELEPVYPLLILGISGSHIEVVTSRHEVTAQINLTPYK